MVGWESLEGGMAFTNHHCRKLRPRVSCPSWSWLGRIIRMRDGDQLEGCAATTTQLRSTLRTIPLWRQSTYLQTSMQRQPKTLALTVPANQRKLRRGGQVVFHGTAAAPIATLGRSTPWEAALRCVRCWRRIRNEQHYTQRV